MPQSAEAVQAQLSKVMEVAVKGIKAQMKWCVGARAQGGAPSHVLD